MDPLSIASASLAFIVAAQKTTTAIYRFLHSCAAARADLIQVERELSALRLTIELIKDEDDTNAQSSLPNVLKEQVRNMLTNCEASAQQITGILDNCSGKAGPIRWTLLEKNKVLALNGKLEAFRSALSIALETVNMFVCPR
jgi:hypothetical protein